jgi:16S rRNA (guanine1207-N2)-methyltransferase
VSGKRPGAGGGKRTPAQRSRGAGAPPPELPKPSADGYRALGPYAKTRFTVHALGLSLGLDVPGDVFSTQRIDEGTQLLLSHLPSSAERPPASLLDLGCGYGALGLPVAARFPHLRALLIDRDLLAVSASAHNAKALGLSNVEARPSLGYRDLLQEERFDWLLCNVPARIGGLAIGAFLEGGRARLMPGGELRMVAIRDLVPTVVAEAERRGLPLVRVVDGPRHSVLALQAAPEPGPLPLEDLESIYLRDRTTLPLPEGPLSLERPHDASEDPGHAAALGLLFEALPRSAPKASLSFRCGFGGAALALRARFPQSPVVAVERDLLDAAFLLRNARHHGLGGPGAGLEVRTALFPAQAGLLPRGFSLVAGEVSPSAGPLVAARELAEARTLLAPGGQALALATVKQRLEWLPKCPGWSVLLERDSVSLWRAAPAPG